MRVIHRLVIVLTFFGLLAMSPMVVIAPPSWYEQKTVLPDLDGLDGAAQAIAIFSASPERLSEWEALEKKAKEAQQARKWAAYRRHTGENWALLFIPGVLAVIVIYPIAWIFAGFRQQPRRNLG